jgi:uncharacterized membrane protein
MPNSNPHATASLRSLPLHAMLVPIPLVCFAITLVTDIVYWQTAAMLWADISAWLLTVGLIVAVFAVVAGVIDFLGNRRIRELRAAKIHVGGNVAALVLTIFNALIHTRDAYTSVVPSGVILSAMVVVILAVTGWIGWTLVHRHAVGVREVGT